MNELLTKKSEITRDTCLAAAIDMVQSEDLYTVCLREVARRENVSERTVYRHFDSREQFQESLTAALLEQLKLPSLPQRVSELEAFVGRLYAQFDAQPRVVVFLLDSQLFPHHLCGSCEARLQTLTSMLKQAFPQQNQTALTIAAANIRYCLSATTWRYYRYYFNFDLQRAVACVEKLLGDILTALHSSQAN